MKCPNSYCQAPEMEAEDDLDYDVNAASGESRDFASEARARRNYRCGDCGLEAHWRRSSGLVIDFDPGVELTLEEAFV